jgi:hypothetical protein
MNVFEFDAELDTGYKTYNIIYDKYEEFEPISEAFLFDHNSIKSSWRPLKLELNDGELYGDISYCCGLSGILFSQHVVTVLEPYLQNTVEFLPLRLQPDKILWAMKVLKIFST